MMNWFADQRQSWIAEMLSIYGFINRQHFQRKFGVSDATAATDFRTFNANNPGVMTYDASRKAYFSAAVPQEPPDPRQTDIEDYLSSPPTENASARTI